jgi:hypothetical protein
MWQAVLSWLRNYDSLAIWLEGVALVFIFFLDWREYRRQGEERVEQHRESAAQMEIMQGQAEATRENALRAKEGADAAKANAEAAKLNAEASKAMLELIINKERARIRVQVKDLDLSLKEYGATTIKYSVHLHGPTEARITGCGAGAYLHTSGQPLQNDAYILPMVLPEVLSPSNPVIEKFSFFMPIVKLQQDDVDRINANKSFVHFRGYIKYKDTFDIQRETKFQYLWAVTEIANLDPANSCFSYWQRRGNENDNCQT